MSLQVDMITSTFLNDTSSSSPLSKRRKFTPPTFHPIIPSADNSPFEHHTFSSPILPQLSSQAPTPEEIEASLLQVGMRIRKSVNDGYQTSPQKKFTPRPFANNLSRLSPETQKALLAGNGSTSQPEQFSAGGLHNVGNMAMQPLATATFCGISLSMMSWASKDYTSPAIENQQMWSYSTSSKRSFDADSDSDESQDWQPRTPTLTPEYGAAMPVDYLNIDADNMSDVSPFTQPSNRVNWRGRSIARPRTRLRPNQMHGVEEMPMPPTSAFNPFMEMQILPEQPHVQAQQLNAFGHNRILSCGAEANIFDFGDTPFLQRRDDVEMDCS